MEVPGSGMDVIVARALARLEALERREAATSAIVEGLVQSVQRLEHQNEQLELRNARLSRTVRTLQSSQTQGNVACPFPEDDPALVAPPPALADLPHEVLICVCSFLGTPDLRRLALVARRFATTRETSRSGAAAAVAQSDISTNLELALPVIIGGARLRALRQSADLVVRPPRIDREETWLHVLRRLEVPRFDDPRGEGHICDDGMTAYNEGGDEEYGEVLCSELQMLAGIHYCEFTIEWDEISGRLDSALLPDVDFGVVGPGYDSPAEDSSAAWLFSVFNGGLFHAGNFADWPGQPGRGEVGHGDTVGLLLDIDEGSIAVFHRRKGGWQRRLGVMMQPGQRNMDGELMAPLSAPLRWAVSLEHGALVRLAAGRWRAPSVARTGGTGDAYEDEAEVVAGY